MRRLFRLFAALTVMGSLFVTAFEPSPVFAAPAAIVRLNMKSYGDHNPVYDARILAIRPEWCIDNPSHGMYGERFGYNQSTLLQPAMAAQYRANGIGIIGYVSCGYEQGAGGQVPGDLGTDFPDLSWYSLANVKKYVANMAAHDLIDGVFIDEISADPIAIRTADFHRELVAYIHSFSSPSGRPLIAWGNTGLDSFNGDFYFNDARYDYIQSSETWRGQALSATQLQWGPRLSVTGFAANYTAQDAYNLTRDAWNKGIGYCYVNTISYTDIAPWFEEYVSLLQNDPLDVLPPYTVGLSPGRGETGVSPDGAITLHVRDDGAGVDKSSIALSVNAAPVEPVITGTMTDYSLTYRPPGGFAADSVVNVTVEARDAKTTPNVMTPDVYSFTVAPVVSPPVVLTGNSMDVTAQSAVISGELTAPGLSSRLEVSFEYGISTAYGRTTPPQNMTVAGNFSTALTGLYPKTAYHYRAKASGGGVIVYGADATFTTLITPPVVSSRAAANVTDTSAIIRGNLGSTGSAENVTVWFEWGQTAAYGNSTIAGVIHSTGNFNFTLTGLTTETTYHFRARAAGDGESTGADTRFTTLAAPPGVTTLSASNITPTGAVLNGRLTGLNDTANTTVSFNWGIDTSYGNATPVQSGTGGPFNTVLSGLTPGTTYHFRATANANGTAYYGADASFTTPIYPPVVATSAAANVTGTSATLNGNLTTLGSYVNATVWFEWGETTAYGNATPSREMTSPGIFESNLTDLTPGRTYHFRAAARAGDATVYGSDSSFATASVVPVVVTLPATGLTETAAALNGNLASTGSYPEVSISFEWGKTTAYGNSTAQEPMNSSGTFSFSLAGLTPGATYHYRAKTVAGNISVFGDDVVFTTISRPPLVATIPAGGTTDKTAMLNGLLSSTGSSSNATVWFEWGQTTTYGNSTPEIEMTATGAFNYTLTGLTPGTTYHFRARAAGSGFNAYGADLSFTTLLIPPSVATGPAGNVTDYTAVLTGNLTATGSFPDAAVNFEWGPTTAYGYATPPQSVNATGEFTFALSGLTPGASYHFRARATGGRSGASETVYGVDVQFTTTVIPPSVSTLQAANITESTVVIRGNLDATGSFSNTTVWFDWGKTADYGSSTPVLGMASPGTFKITLSGLTPGATYHYRAAASGGESGASEFVYGADVAFTASTLYPVVLTGPAGNVTTASAALTGNLVSVGAADYVMVYFEWGETADYGGLTTIRVLSSPGNITHSLSGLEPGITYHYRLTASGMGTVSGDDTVFTTETGLTVSGRVYEVIGTPLAGATVSVNGAPNAVTGAGGDYTIAVPASGNVTIAVSSAGFRTAALMVDAVTLNAGSIIDFKGRTGLIPNAPNLSYVLSCLNRWKFPPADGAGPDLSTVLAVINAWKFPR